jgi:hypothetical protein
MGRRPDIGIPKYDVEVLLIGGGSGALLDA